MTKYDRARTNEVYVCSFIPSYKLPKKMTWSLDPFLCPLVNEIEDLFINGTIQYSPFITSHMRGIFRVAPRNFFRGKTKNLCGAW